MAWHLSVWSFHVLLVSVWVLSGHWVQKPALGLIVDSNLPTVVNVRVKGCLPLYGGPVVDWWPVQRVLCLSADGSWDWLQHSSEP